MDAKKRQNIFMKNAMDCNHFLQTYVLTSIYSSL